MTDKEQPKIDLKLGPYTKTVERTLIKTRILNNFKYFFKQVHEKA